MELIEILGKARALAEFDTNAAIFRCRQFAESMTRALAEKAGTDIAGIPFVDQINMVGAALGLSSTAIRALHNVRILGNKAVHHHLSGDDEARAVLTLCEEILAGTKDFLPPGVAVDPSVQPVEEAEPETEDDFGPQIEAIKALRAQASKHRFAGRLDVQAANSFELIGPDLVMKLTTSGVPRHILEQEGLVTAQPAGAPIDLRKIGHIGALGFRLCGEGDSNVKLIVPPTARPAADLGLSPLGDAYVDALCRASYMEGQLSGREVQEHIKYSLLKARAAYYLRLTEWPTSISYYDLKSSTIAAFQWPNSIRQLMVGPRMKTPTLLKDFIGRTPCWFNGGVKGATLG